MTEIKSRSELPKLLIEFGLPLIAVEVGVECAANATDLLREGIEKIYLVDTWEVINEGDDHFNTALKNLSHFGKGRYEILKGRSDEMHTEIPDNSLGLVYIDGLHTYEGCKSDIENYYPKLVDGGLIAFHDYMNPGLGIDKAVNEFVYYNNLEFHYIPETGAGDAGCWVRKPMT